MKKVLIISPVHTHPTYAGNSERIYRFMLALSEIGCQVYFLHLPFSQLFGKYDESAMKKIWGEEGYLSFPYTYPRNLSDIGLRAVFNRFIRKLASVLNLSYRPIFLIDEWYDNKLNPFLQKLIQQEKFDAVIAEYIFFSKALENFPESTLKIIDTHDVFTDRQKLSPSFFYTNSFNEKKGLNRADKIIAIQDQERRFFEEKLGLKGKVCTISHFVELDNLYDLTVKNRIGFFGSANQFNLKGFNFFVENVFPQIKQQIPDAVLVIGGRMCDRIEDNENYEKLGEIEDKKEFYQQISIVINPMLFGTGIKIKTVEALGYGMPLVTTSAGAEGVEKKANTAFLLANKEEEFAEKVIMLLCSQDSRHSLSQKAFQFAQQLNTQNLSNLRHLLDIKH